ncbi:GntR family transcriptional regulator [Humibacter albus]|uniref:GntR family transcriptional regulator n=1 Tax=Humibacter albus TaxID=427754 RepID=UPI0003B50602|nr:GntR family transcriptional regulator [Humibacter albus]
MQIVVSQTSPVPLYEQIKDQIRAAIFTGALAAGENLPSLRELARDLQVSLITVTRAYNDLAVEGMVGTHQGKGTVVMAVEPALLRAHVDNRIRRGLAEAVEAARLGGVGLDALQCELDRVWDAATQKNDEEDRK